MFSSGMDIVSALNESTEVLSLMNMITLDDLLDDDEYAGRMKVLFKGSFSSNAGQKPKVFSRA